MKLRLSDVEIARSNPKAFVQGAVNGPKGFKSRFVVLRSIAMSYHATNDLRAAITSLESRLQKQFKMQTANQRCVQQLQEYVVAFEKLGTSVARVRNDVTVPLPEEYQPFRVTGQIARLDVVSKGGYRAWLFVSKTGPWGEELRFPLLQLASAAQLAVDPQEVIPGVYNFATATYSEVPSTKAALAKAHKELLQVLDSLKHFGALKKK